MAHAGQVVADAARVYEEALVPAVFAEWAPRLVDAARIEGGDRVLDVACGTGIVAREAARRRAARAAAAGGEVVGLDCNPAMLAVAKEQAPDITWREGRAEALPFQDEAFDAVTCGFGLMYFDDPSGALREMHRVARPGGRVALATWDSLENQPAEAALVRLLANLFGEAAADELRAPFSAGDPREMRARFEEAGFADIGITTVEGTSRAPSVRAYVDGIVRGWTLVDKLDEEEIRRLLDAADARISPLARRVGDAVVLPAPAHIVTARRP